MRLFVAIDLPATVKNQLETLQRPIPGARWVKRPAFHLTLQFLGDGIPDERLTDIRDALATIHADAFTMALRGVGHFGGRALWAGVDAPPALAALHRQVGEAMRAVGFPPDTRRFSPHITLARLRDTSGRRELDAFLAQHAGFSTESFPVEAFALFSSQLTPQGARYTIQAEFPLFGRAH